MNFEMIRTTEDPIGMIRISESSLYAAPVPPRTYQKSSNVLKKQQTRTLLLKSVIEVSRLESPESIDCIISDEILETSLP